MKMTFCVGGDSNKNISNKKNRTKDASCWIKLFAFKQIFYSLQEFKRRTLESREWRDGQNSTNLGPIWGNVLWHSKGNCVSQISLASHRIVSSCEGLALLNRLLSYFEFSFGLISFFSHHKETKGRNDESAFFLQWRYREINIVHRSLFLFFFLSLYLSFFLISFFWTTTKSKLR